MTSGDGIEALIERIFLEDTEFHFSVTHHVGVRGDSFFVSIDEILDDMLAILIYKIYNFVIDSQMRGNRSRVFYVLLRGAVRQWHFFIHPSLNVGARYFITRLFKKDGCDGAINPPR